MNGSKRTAGGEEKGKRWKMRVKSNRSARDKKEERNTWEVEAVACEKGKACLMAAAAAAAACSSRLVV